MINYNLFCYIDPTCGSGHFLLGAFEWLAPLWLRQQPDNVNVALQAALDHIAGIDLNPFSVVITRFRLLIAVLKRAEVPKRKLKSAPTFRIQVEIGDSLLHGFDQRDYVRGQAALDLDMPQENLERGGSLLYRHAYAAEDLEAVNKILARKYTVVVGNPPYITVKDAAISKLYRERYQSCHRQYALVAPFCERFWALAKPFDHTQRGGFVGLIVANSFMKREFGKKLVEAFFPSIDLSHVIDTSGAYIPGHGTPTVILFGRNRKPASSTVRAAMGIKGEPATSYLWFIQPFGLGANPIIGARARYPKQLAQKAKRRLTQCIQNHRQRPLGRSVRVGISVSRYVVQPTSFASVPLNPTDPAVLHVIR